MVFDLEKGSILYIDLAKSNSRPKHSRTGWCLSNLSLGLQINYLVTRRTHPDRCSHCTCFACLGASRFWQHSHTWNGLGNLKARAASEITAAKLVGRHFSLLFFLSQFQFLAVTYLLFSPAPNCNHSSVPPNVPKIGTPCPTLFVANLRPTCTEQGLIQVFSRCPRYLKLKMQSTHGALIAFVDFQIKELEEQFILFDQQKQKIKMLEEQHFQMLEMLKQITIAAAYFQRARAPTRLPSPSPTDEMSSSSASAIS
ncbi:uncharacterized protein LOC116105964 isoform X2 [Pistacia vera]|uniref:uncharacterized protein LOC116105964 isoform X2 n=1 Tax=Pistacia vera TaxID=55513 RepID=UPI00126393D7|nr:uncharacterized protein LOC116105964 isoform X2 [Pistacia vera]